MAHLAFKASSGRTTPSVAGSIPALSAKGTRVMTDVRPPSDDDVSGTLRSVPAVGKFMDHPRVQRAAAGVGHAVLHRLVRDMLESRRQQSARDGETPIDFERFCDSVVHEVADLSTPSLRSVVNATGVVVHTNLGRAPLSRVAAEHVAAMAQGYTNLELDLATGQRRSRQSHLGRLLRTLTEAEDILVVNNNAAAILLVARALAFHSEVIVSRGELVEIGESFRLPDIMKAGGARLVEVGSTNRTRIADYEDAIGDRTAMLFKAHTSNFKTIGFTEQVSIKELAACARKRGHPCVYDLGSGMLRRPQGLAMGEEPSVEEALHAGADLVTFSGDKLFGGAQAGVVAGRKDLIGRLARSPIMRALRPGRLPLAALEAVALQYLDERRLPAENPVFRMLGRSSAELRVEAEQLAASLDQRGVVVEVVASQGQVGGGALPGSLLPGWAVRIVGPAGFPSISKKASTRLFLALLHGQPAVLGVLREGRVVLDVRCLDRDAVDRVADAVKIAVNGCSGK